VEEVSAFNKFFPIVDACLSCEDMCQTKLCDGAKMAIFLRPVFSGSSVQHVAHFRHAF